MILYHRLDEHDMSVVRLVTGSEGQAMLEELSLGTSHSIRLSPEAQQRLYDVLGQHLERPLTPSVPLSTPMDLDEMATILSASGYLVRGPDEPRSPTL